MMAWSYSGGERLKVKGHILIQVCGGEVIHVDAGASKFIF